jgi:transcriptional regulator with XRE-family HTH domain
VSGEQESLGGRVRRLRLARGLSQEELARQLGVSKTQVYLVERGKTLAPQAEVLRAYARVLGVSIGYLRHGVEDEPVPGPAEWPPLEVYLRHTSTLSPEEIAQIVRIVRALELEQRRELAVRERDEQRKRS